MPRPDEGLIHAWLDGELEAEEAARVERLVATDAEWAAAAAEARGLIAASSRILSALDVVAGDVIPHGGSAAPAISPAGAARTAPRRMVPQWMKMAAGIVLIAGIGYVARDGVSFGAPEAASAPQATVVPDVEDSVAGPAREMMANDQRTPIAPSAKIATNAAAAGSDADAIARVRGAAEPEARLRDDAPARAPSPAPAAAQSVADAAAPVAELSARQAPVDSQTLRRSLSQNRLEGVVVTGVTGGAAGQSAERSGVRAMQPAAKSAVPASAPPAFQAAPPPPLPIIEGCFRIRTRARIDTLLRDPTILATDADSIRIAIPSANFAWIRRDSTGALVGRVWWQRGTANMRADPIDCS